MSRPLVIFDLDGTMLHTAPDLLASLNHSIQALDLEPIASEDVNGLVGAGARAMIERALVLHRRTVNAADLDMLFDRFLDHYSRSMPGCTAPYPGLVDALDRLQSAQMSLAVCTNKTEAMARRLLELLDLSPRFDAITGGDTFDCRKPDGNHIRGTIRQAKGSPDAAVMVGDSVNDIAAAKDAGIPAIAVPFGYTDTPVDALDPDTVIPHFDELTPELVVKLIR